MGRKIFKGLFPLTPANVIASAAAAAALVVVVAAEKYTPAITSAWNQATGETQRHQQALNADRLMQDNIRLMQNTIANETAESIAKEYHGCPTGPVTHNVLIAHPTESTGVGINRASSAGLQAEEMLEVTVTDCRAIPETTLANGQNVGGQLLTMHVEGGTYHRPAGDAADEPTVGDGFAYVPPSAPTTASRYTQNPQSTIGNHARPHRHPDRVVPGFCPTPK